MDVLVFLRTMMGELFGLFDELLDITMALFPALPWLFVLPLFFSTPPPGEPEGYDGCTHWEDCVKELESFRKLSGPDKEHNKDTPAEE